MEQEVIAGSLLKRGIKLKLPDVLPRAMNPSDVRKLLYVIDDIRERALFLVLLRTGIRIGEALGLRLNDLDIKGRKVHLFEGEKNSMGRVVYLSDDALFALNSGSGAGTRPRSSSFTAGAMGTSVTVRAEAFL